VILFPVGVGVGEGVKIGEVVGVGIGVFVGDGVVSGVVGEGVGGVGVSVGAEVGSLGVVGEGAAVSRGGGGGGPPVEAHDPLSQLLAHVSEESNAPPVLQTHSSFFSSFSSFFSEALCLMSCCCWATYTVRGMIAKIARAARMLKVLLWSGREIKFMNRCTGFMLLFKNSRRGDSCQLISKNRD